MLTCSVVAIRRLLAVQLPRVLRIVYAVCRVQLCPAPYIFLSSVACVSTYIDLSILTRTYQRYIFVDAISKYNFMFVPARMHTVVCICVYASVHMVVYAAACVHISHMNNCVYVCTDLCMCRRMARVCVVTTATIIFTWPCTTVFAVDVCCLSTHRATDSPCNCSCV